MEIVFNIKQRKHIFSSARISFIFTITLKFIVVVVKKKYLCNYVLLKLRQTANYKHNKYT